MAPDWLTTLIGLGAVRFHQTNQQPPRAVLAGREDLDVSWQDGSWAVARFGYPPGERLGWEDLTAEQREDFARFAEATGLGEPTNQIKLLELEADETHAQATDLSARHALLKARMWELKLEQAVGGLTERLQQVRWMYENGNLVTWPLPSDEWGSALTIDLGLDTHHYVSIAEGTTASIDRDGQVTLMFQEPEAMRRFVVKHDLWMYVEWGRLTEDINDVQAERDRMAEWVAGWREFKTALDRETSKGTI